MTRVLFVCGKNRLRSPTAEQVFASWPGLEVASAGVDNDADERVSPELLEWAELILVMEPGHRRKIQSRFRKALGGKRIVSLDIPDRYALMQPELVRLLEERVPRHLRSA